MARATLSHQLHDLGLAVWFGGTLANAVALNKGAAAADDPQRVGAVVQAGWQRWQPVNAAAVGVHLVGAAGLLKHDLGRAAAQKGVPSMAAAKIGLTLAALATTAYAGILGRKLSARQPVPAAEGATPTSATPPDAAGIQRQLKVLQWASPAITASIVAIGAYASEQYRPEEVSRGVVQRVFG